MTPIAPPPGGIIPNIPRVFTALAEWGSCLLYIRLLPLRPGQSAPRRAAAALITLAVQCVFLEATGTLPLIYWVPCMGAAALLMLGLVWLCCDVNPPTAVYCTVRAFLLAEFIASLEWQLYYYAAEEFRLWNWPLAFVVLVPIYAVLFLLAWLLETRHELPRVITPFRTDELWVPLAIALSAFAMSNLSFVLSDTPFSSSVISDIHTIRTLVDLAGVAALYAFHVQRAQRLTRRELDSIQNILQNQYVQYQQSRESIEAINRKYHDLKHQIAVLRAETDPERRSAFLDGMEEEIREYEAQNKTGSPVLDTVLTGKSLYCARHGVTLTAVADGALLGFMDVMDICTVFGNILDNAIECELRIPDREKRLIHLAVYRRGALLVIHCENYNEETPVFQDGLPVTTKKDTDYHGYGLKSIRYTAEKYGGTMTVSTRDSWFDLNIVIPMAERT